MCRGARILLVWVEVMGLLKRVQLHMLFFQLDVSEICVRNEQSGSIEQGY